MLISYENEAIRAQDAGEDVDYIVPDDTIQIRHGRCSQRPSPQNPEAAQAFLDYLLLARGAADLGRQRLPPGRPGRC